MIWITHMIVELGWSSARASFWGEWISPNIGWKKFRWIRCPNTIRMGTNITIRCNMGKKLLGMFEIHETTCLLLSRSTSATINLVQYFFSVCQSSVGHRSTSAEKSVRYSQTTLYYRACNPQLGSYMNSTLIFPPRSNMHCGHKGQFQFSFFRYFFLHPCVVTKKANEQVFRMSERVRVALDTSQEFYQ